jgi:hypothetical protein
MSGFDRIRAPQDRLLHRREGAHLGDEADGEGRAALFSGGPATNDAVEPGAATVHCGRCEATSRLGAAAALRSAFPLFLVAPWKRHPVFAVCPACHHRAWLRPSLGG